VVVVVAGAAMVAAVAVEVEVLVVNDSYLMCWFVINALATFPVNVGSSAVSMLFAVRTKMITRPTFQVLRI
jgi:ATP-dependent Clp protease adapter protein ClpS